MAEGAGFEPARPCGLSVFKTDAFNRSATPPEEAAIFDGPAMRCNSNVAAVSRQSVIESESSG